MHFNVSQLLNEQSGSTREYAVDGPLNSNDGSPPQLFEGAIRLRKTDKGVWATAALETRAALVCSRCAEDYADLVHVAFDEEFFPPVDINTGEKLTEVNDAEESRSIDHDNALDLTDAVRQYYALAIPMKPICRKDCRGICSVCGTNQNESTCDCNNEAGDSRMAALLDLVPSGEPAEES